MGLCFCCSNTSCLFPPHPPTLFVWLPHEPHRLWGSSQPSEAPQALLESLRAQKWFQRVIASTLFRFLFVFPNYFPVCVNTYVWLYTYIPVVLCHHSLLNAFSLPQIKSSLVLPTWLPLQISLYALFIHTCDFWAYKLQPSCLIFSVRSKEMVSERWGDDG